MRFLLFLCFSFPIMHLSAQSLQYSDKIPVEELRLSLQHALGGVVGERIQDLNYFQLYAKNKNEIINSVNNFIVNEDNIIITSNGSGDKFWMEDIFLIKKEGGLINKIPSKALGLAESETINAVRSWKDGFIIGSSQSNFFIQNNGNIRKSIISDHSVFPDDSIKLNQAAWYYYNSRDMKKKHDNTALKVNNEIMIQYGADRKADFFYDITSNFSNISKGDTIAYASFVNNYDVFELNDTAIQKIYKIMLPLENTLDTSLYYKISTDDSLTNFQKRTPNAIIGFDQILKYKDYLLLNLKSISGDKTWIAINLLTNELISLSNILPDTSNDFLPIMGWNQYLTTDGKYLYSVIYPNEIEDSKSKCEEENHPMTKKNKDLLNSINPILVRFILN